MASSSQKFIFDLISELRNDPARREAVVENMQRIDRLTVDVAAGKASNSDIQAAQAELVQNSGFNFGLLMPTYFHKYPLDEPLSFIDRPFMFPMTNMAPDSTVTLKAGRQVGKCAVGNTEVSTSKGPMTLKAIFDMGLSV